MMTQEAIFDNVRGYLHEMFEIAPERVTLEAELITDLQLDSIDALDLIIRIGEMTGRRLRADEFRTVRSVGDVVERVHAIVTS